MKFTRPILPETGFVRLPQILAVSGIAVLVTGVALLARNHHTRIEEKS